MHNRVRVADKRRGGGHGRRGRRQGRRVFRRRAAVGRTQSESVVLDGQEFAAERRGDNQTEIRKTRDQVGADVIRSSGRFVV